MQARKVLKEIDLNGNGFVELQEFIGWCAKNTGRYEK